MLILYLGRLLLSVDSGVGSFTLSVGVAPESESQILRIGSRLIEISNCLLVVLEQWVVDSTPKQNKQHCECDTSRTRPRVRLAIGYCRSSAARSSNASAQGQGMKL